MAFKWPWQYDFPPFYTLQPNVDTREKQIDGWCNLVLSYHRSNKLFKLDLKEASASPLFNNKKINRRLSEEAILLVLETLKNRGNLEWMDKQKAQCLVLWRTIDEWANIIHKWVCDGGLNNTICTVFELQSGDDTTSQEFHGIDLNVLHRALKLLEKQGKAEIISGSASDGSDAGVKFF
ncbi:vacuolar protein-sorting-associated protein 25-like [Oscarella lobularis]|uniref:vacuolar protein-sorting-associated protein 25-like n=1 Tax=Oscarella lobularis TaxID=121494 RepID=UPI0033130E28